MNEKRAEGGGHDCNCPLCPIMAERRARRNEGEFGMVVEFSDTIGDPVPGIALALAFPPEDE